MLEACEASADDTAGSVAVAAMLETSEANEPAKLEMAAEASDVTDGRTELAALPTLEAAEATDEPMLERAEETSPNADETVEGRMPAASLVGVVAGAELAPVPTAPVDGTMPSEAGELATLLAAVESDGAADEAGMALEMAVVNPTMMPVFVGLELAGASVDGLDSDVVGGIAGPEDPVEAITL